MTSRRGFLQTAGLGIVGLPMAAVAGSIAPGESVVMGSGLPLTTLQLGIAGYTFAKVPLDGAIVMMNRLGINNLSIKDFHLPLDSSPDKIQSVKGQLTAAGIKIYAAGVIYMKSNAEVDRAFDYAHTLGVNLIIAAPNPELLPYVEQKVKSTGIRIAIHNHGPEDKLYPSPVDVYNHIKDMDAGMGLCLDIGHAARAGADPARIVTDYAPRIFDLHIKDLAVITRVAQPIVLGRGVLDIPALVRALAGIRFAGICSIEHEMDMTDPMPGIAESAGFFRGVIKML